MRAFLQRSWRFDESLFLEAIGFVRSSDSEVGCVSHGDAGLKIVHWAKFYPPEWGGTEAVTAALAEAAVRHGHDVQAIAYTDIDRPKSEMRHGVKLKLFRSFGRISSQPLSLRYAICAIWAAQNADVVHIHAPNIFSSIYLLLLNRRTTRIVTHWHTDIVNKGWLGILVMPLQYLLAKMSHAIIATSEPYALSSNVLRRNLDRVRIVPLGIQDPLPEEIADSLPPEIEDFIRGRKVVLSIGRLVPYKGFEVLIDATRDLAEDSCVVIIGSGILETALRARIEEFGLCNKILMVGRLNRTVLNLMLRRCDLYVMSSVMRSEAFGVVLLEAMACSRPVIATNIDGSGVPWVNQHDVTGLNVPPHNAPSLADAIKRVLGDPALGRNYGLAGRRRFDSLFQESIMIERVMALYGDA